MVYRAVGLMSGSSLDGLDMVFVTFQEDKGKWTFEIKAGETGSFPDALRRSLLSATELNARDYLLLHTRFGRFCGERVNAFLKKNDLAGKTDVIGTHGHTTFHMPEKGMTHQLGEGAAIAAVSGIPVVSDLRSMDVALGGQGAPIVPVGEKLLFAGHKYYLNIGGIANISVHERNKVTAFDVCPANRVLNMLASLKKRKYDDNGQMASKGTIDHALLKKLNQLKFYKMAYPKSLANDFGTDVIFPMIMESKISVPDALNTYCEHIAQQVANAVSLFQGKRKENLLVSGGGALNGFLISRIKHALERLNVSISVPAPEIIHYKEALIMALIAVLRMRNEQNVYASVTGAEKSSVGGALWFGK